MRTRPNVRWLVLVVPAALACADGPATPLGVAAIPADFSGSASIATFELLGGYRLDVAYASEGLAIVKDADGFAVEAVAGAHAHTGSVHLYDLRGPLGVGAEAALYPLVAPTNTWKVSDLFPRWISGQSLRDVTAVGVSGNFELAGLGRVFYNTTPRPTTQVSVRTILGRGNSATLGTTREIPVNLPEQEFSGFIKHDEARRDLGAIGAGAYDSGQGSVAGLSYAVRQTDGSWTRLLTPPSFGDLASARLPRDADYSCPEGTSWVCIPPVNGRGVWSTERIGGGGVRFGDHVMFIATLGYGPRTYGRQSYTFGDPGQDRAVAYFFRHDPVTSAVTLQRFDRWSFAAPGENVLGTALGRVRGSSDLVLFVVKANAWGSGPGRTGSVLQLFRIKPR